MDKVKIQVILCGDLEPAKHTFSNYSELVEFLERMDAVYESKEGHLAKICNFYWSAKTE